MKKKIKGAIEKETSVLRWLLAICLKAYVSVSISPTISMYTSRSLSIGFCFYLSLYIELCLSLSPCFSFNHTCVHCFFWPIAKLSNKSNGIERHTECSWKHNGKMMSSLCVFHVSSSHFLWSSLMMVSSLAGCFFSAHFFPFIFSKCTSFLLEDFGILSF